MPKFVWRWVRVGVGELGYGQLPPPGRPNKNPKNNPPPNSEKVSWKLLKLSISHTKKDGNCDILGRLRTENYVKYHYISLHAWHQASFKEGCTSPHKKGMLWAGRGSLQGGGSGLNLVLWVLALILVLLWALKFRLTIPPCHVPSLSRLHGNPKERKRLWCVYSKQLLLLRSSSDAFKEWEPHRQDGPTATWQHWRRRGTAEAVTGWQHVCAASPVLASVWEMTEY